MRTRGDFTIHRFEITDWKYGETTYLFPFGDIHKSSPMHHKEKWAEWLEYAKTKKRAYFLGMGDYDDLASTSERKILSDDNLHESTVKTLEEIYLKNTIKFAKDIEFMKGRLIGMLSGNHYGFFQNGTTTDQKLCELLNCKYLGVNTFIEIVFVPHGHHGARTSLQIFAHHGRGGSRTIGGSMNPVHKMAEVAEADIYLMGDNHQKEISHKERLVLRRGGGKLRLGHRKQMFARTGSYLKGYEEGERSYIVDMLLPPSDLGTIKIELTPKRHQPTEDGGREDISYIDIHASL